MTLSEVWTPIRTDIATLIVTTYNSTTEDTITSAQGTKIEAMLYNLCHHLLNCDMMFASTTTLLEMQTMLKNEFNHACYNLVNTWKLINLSVSSGSGKNIHQESYYDVADTPKIEIKDFNDLNIKTSQIQALMSYSSAFKAFYNDIKNMVQTLYYV